MMEKDEKKLMELLLNGELEEVERILEQGFFSREDLERPHNSEGSTPLISTCQKGLTEVMRFLLDRGVDMTLHNQSGQTALHISQPGLQRELLAAMVRPVSHEAQLLESAWRGDINGFQHLLTQMDVLDLDVNMQNRDGLTPLMLAVRDVDLFVELQVNLTWDYRPTEVVKTLLLLSANAEIQDHKGYTALHYASQLKSHVRDELVQIMQESLPQSALTSHVESVRHFPSGRCVNSLDSAPPGEFPSLVDETDRVHLDERFPGTEVPDAMGHDKTAALSLPNPMESVRKTRRGIAKLNASTGWTSSLPSLRNRNNCLDKFEHWDFASKVALMPIPPRLPVEKNKALKESHPDREFSQLSRSAPSLALLDSSVLVQARVNIQNRLGCAEIFSDINGQKVLPSVPSPRTPKQLAPLERRHRHSTALLNLQHPLTLEPINIMQFETMSRQRYSRNARKNSEESCSSRDSVDLDEDEVQDEVNVLQKVEQTLRTFESKSHVTLHPLSSTQHFGKINVDENLKSSNKNLERKEETKEEQKHDSKKELPKREVTFEGTFGSQLKFEGLEGGEENRAVCSVGHLEMDKNVDITGMPLVNPDRQRDVDLDAAAEDGEGRTSALVEAIHAMSSLASVGKIPVKVTKSKERKGRPLQNNQSFNMLATGNKNRTILNPRRNRRTSSPAKIKARDTADQKFNGDTFTKLDCPQSPARLSQKSQDVPLARKRTPEPLHHVGLIEDKKSVSKPQRHKNLADREPKTPRQSEKCELLGLHRMKTVLDDVSYSDMFMQLHKGGEGPAIFEMFATPVYENLRAASCVQRCKQVQSASQVKRRSSGQPRVQKPIEGSRRKQCQKSGSAKGKQRKRRQSQGKGTQHQLTPLKIDKNEPVVILDIHNQISKRGILTNEDTKDVSGDEEKQVLSVIKEVLSDTTGTIVRHQHLPSLSHSVLKRSLSGQIILLGKDDHKDNNRVFIEDEYSDVDKFPAQPMINTWTSERKVSPVYHKFLDGVDEGPVTDDLLRCLAQELISLEEREVETLKPENAESEETVSNLPPKAKKVLSEGTSFKISSTEKSSVNSITWTKGEVLGRGAYGTVYCGLTGQGELIAVKQVTLDVSNSETAQKEYEQLQREVELLKNLRHPNIVEFLGTTLSENVVSIFMEYVPGGSISNVLARFGPLPEKVFALYTRQILEGVAYLHSNRVIHRDVKGNNVMLMPTGVIKLIDFGCARRLNRLTPSEDLLKSVHGTPYWMAPEVINETGHGRKSDVWSVGCTVFEMATGKPPLAHMGKMAALFYIGARKGLMPPLPDDFSEEARGFVQACLISDQKQRPSAAELLRHPFVLHLRQPCSRLIRPNHS